MFSAVMQVYCVVAFVSFVGFGAVRADASNRYAPVRQASTSCQSPTSLSAGEPLRALALPTESQVHYYSYDAGATAKALVFKVEPGIPGDYFELLMIHESKLDCANFSSVASFGSYICDGNTECPENVQEREKQYMVAGLKSDIVYTEEISVGVHAPSLVQTGKWRLMVRGKTNQGTLADSGIVSNDKNSYKVTVRSGIDACVVPKAEDMNVNMCRQYVDYHVLDVKLLQRDSRAERVGLSVNDPRPWMAHCRVNVDALFCYQTFMQCMKDTGIAQKLCPDSCKPMEGACEPSPNHTVANLQDLNGAVCLLPGKTMAPFNSRFSTSNSDCFAVKGVDQYISPIDETDTSETIVMLLDLVWAMLVVTIAVTISYFAYQKYHTGSYMSSSTGGEGMGGGDNAKHKQLPTYLEEADGFEIAEI